MPAHERTRSWESNSFRSELLQSVGSAPQKDYLREQALILLDKVRNGEELSDQEKAFIRDTSAAVSDIMTPLQAALMGHVDPDRIVQDQQEFISAIPTEIASALTTWSPTEDQEDTLEQLLFIQPLLHSVARDPSVSQPRVLIETLADLNTIKDIFPTETLPLVRELGRYAVEDPGLAQQIAALPLHRELNQFLLQNGEIPLFVTTEPTVDLTIPDPPGPAVRQNRTHVYDRIDALNTKYAPNGFIDEEGWRGYRQELEQLMERNERSGDPLARLRLEQKDIDFILQKIRPGLSDKEILAIRALDDPQMFARIYKGLLKDKALHERLESRRGSLERRVQNDRPGYTDLASAQERELEIMVSDEFARLMSKAVITMYSAILHEAPDAQFSHMASGAVTQDNRNPEQVYRRMLAMLTQLSDRAQQVETSDHPLAQLIRRGEKKRIVIGANGGAKEIIVPAVEFIDSGVSEFAQYLREILEASRGMVEYGHNFRFQMQQFQSGVDQGGTPNLFLKQVAAHAKRELPSERLDTISRLDHTGELVEAARMKYASKFQQLFSAREWRRTPDLVIRELMRSDTRLEEEIRGELEEQYGDTVEPWLLSWAYTMARTEFMGIDFGYHQTTSYADPNLDKDGKPTFTAEDAYQAILNFGDDAMRLQIKPVLLAGAMWAPVLYDWRQWRFNHDDVERIGKRSFQDSFKMGKLAKMGTPIEGYDLYMELGNKLTRRGGFFTNSGSALTGTYQEWIRDVLDPGSDGKKMAYSRDSLAQGWKCLENIGVDVLRNYFETFALGEIKDGTSMSDKAPEPSEKYVTAMKGLAGFLWDRYVEPNNDIAKTAFGDAPVDSKGSFVNYVGEILTSGGTEYKLRRKELMSRVYAGIEAIMIFEQLPSTYLTIEKRRVSEYGVLLSERIRSSITAPTGQAAEFERTYGVDSTDEEQWFRWYRTAVADLAFVEEALRMATSKEMDQILLEQGNLYGNLDNTRSSIRQGKGNRIDIDYIEQTLRARFTAGTRITPEERDRRIKATLLLYSRLKEQVGHVPTVSDVLSNKAIAALGDKKKLADIDDKTIRKEQAARYAAILEKAQSGRMNSPIGWLAGGIQDGTFGFSLTSQTIPLRYLHMSASGSDTISKTALQTASTAELQYRMGGFSLWGGAKKALGALGKDPEEAFKAIFEYVNAAKGPSSDYLDSATVGTVGLAYLDLFQLFLRQDDKYARSVPARIDYEAKDKKRSFSDNTVADGAKLPASMGIYEQHALGIAATESGVLPYYKSANGEQWRTLNLNHPTLSRIPGLKNYLARHVRVRDFAREQSAESRGRAHSASEREYELYVYLPFLLLFFANFIFGAIKNGIKELKIG